MAFNCSIFLEDIDINCRKSNAGGIYKVVLGLQKDLTVDLDPVDETLVNSAILNNHVVFEHNKKDAITVFNESKKTSNGLGIITTDITVRIPSIDRRMNKIDYMSRRTDIVCILYHNNGTATISGWMDGLVMDYSATSNVSPFEESYTDITLSVDSWIASLAVDEPGVIDLP
jgi:hypothetical protein